MSSGTEAPTGLWLEDLSAGQAIALGPLVCSGAAIDGYAAATGDDHPIHGDRAAAQALGLPDRIAQGPLPLGFVLSALAARLGPSVRTLLAIDTWQFKGPAIADVPLEAAAEVAEIGPPGRSSAAVTFAVALTDAGGRTAQSGRVTFLVRRRDGAAADAR